jgi:hypothetical protein
LGILDFSKEEVTAVTKEDLKGGGDGANLGLIPAAEAILASLRSAPTGLGWELAMAQPWNGRDWDKEEG